MAAAALALGRCGDASDVRLLESRLQSRLPEVRLAAAEGLAGLSKESGLAALERLALDQRPTVRQRAVAAMGRTGEAELAAAIVERLDDEAAVKHAALESLRQIAPDAAADCAGRPRNDDSRRRNRRLASLGQASGGARGSPLGLRPNDSSARRRLHLEEAPQQVDAAFREKALGVKLQAHQRIAAMPHRHDLALAVGRVAPGETLRSRR